MKKILIIALSLILAAVAAYYAFPERMAAYMIEEARNSAGLVKKQINVGDHDAVTFR